MAFWSAFSFFILGGDGIFVRWTYWAVDFSRCSSATRKSRSRCQKSVKPPEPPWLSNGSTVQKKFIKNQNNKHIIPLLLLYSAIYYVHVCLCMCEITWYSTLSQDIITARTQDIAWITAIARPVLATSTMYNIVGSQLNMFDCNKGRLNGRHKDLS